MFTGFASENTPAIQVWDFFKTNASSSAVSYVSLSDDCAPIHIFRTGGASSNISIFLPSAPIEGKVINISNQTYGFSNQALLIKSSDVGGDGTASTLATLGQGSLITLVYSKQAISFTDFPGNLRSGWLQLNQMSQTSGNYGSAVLSGDNNRASQSYSVVLGGSTNITNQQYASVLGGSSNAANAISSTVVGGSSNNVTSGGTRGGIVSGQSNTVSSTNSCVIGGSSNSASANPTVVVGGNNNLADAALSAVVGGAYGTTRAIVGNAILPASNSPIASAAGVSQSALLVLGVATTNATATVLRSNTSAAGTTNQVILPNNSAYTFQGTCIANVTGGSTTSGWKFEGVIKRGANAASTTLVAAVTPTVIAQDVAAATWALAITADTTNGGIAVTVTGAAATTIRWVSRIETTEVTF